MKFNVNNINEHTKMSKQKKLYLLGAIRRVKSNYRPLNVRENVPSVFNKDTSYTINKGDVFSLCLRFVSDKDNFHDFNTIMFVALHELSHLFSETYGHNKEFWTNFKFILQQAIGINVYTPLNYKYNKTPYCGIMITYNPFYDTQLENF
jgi:hypothetical protein